MNAKKTCVEVAMGDNLGSPILFLFVYSRQNFGESCRWYRNRKSVWLTRARCDCQSILRQKGVDFALVKKKSSLHLILRAQISHDSIHGKGLMSISLLIRPAFFFLSKNYLAVLYELFGNVKSFLKINPSNSWYDMNEAPLRNKCEKKT